MTIWLGPADLLHDPEYAGHERNKRLGIQAVARSDWNRSLGGDCLDVDEPPDAVLSLAPTEPGVLHSAHRCIDAAERCAEALIDIHRAAFDLARYAPPAIMVRGPYAGVEAICGIVGPRHCLVLVDDRIHADDRAERLIGVAVHFRRHADQNG